MTMSRRKSSARAALLGLLTPGLVLAAPVDNIATQPASACSEVAQITNALGAYSSANAVCAQVRGEEVVAVTSTPDKSLTSTTTIQVTTGTVTVTLSAPTISA